MSLQQERSKNVSKCVCHESRGSGEGLLGGTGSVRRNESLDLRQGACECRLQQALAWNTDLRNHRQTYVHVDTGKRGSDVALGHLPQDGAPGEAGQKRDDSADGTSISNFRRCITAKDTAQAGDQESGCREEERVVRRVTKTSDNDGNEGTA